MYVCEAVGMFHHRPPLTAVSAASLRRDVIVCMLRVAVPSMLAAFYMAVLSQVTGEERGGQMVQVLSFYDPRPEAAHGSIFSLSIKKTPRFGHRKHGWKSHQVP